MFNKAKTFDVIMATFNKAKVELQDYIEERRDAICQTATIIIEQEQIAIIAEEEIAKANNALTSLRDIVG